MWKNIAIVLVLNVVTFLINTDAALFPSICKLEDYECVRKTAQDFVPTFAAGISEVGVEQCDPLYIKSIDLSVPGLKLKLKDATVAGLKDTVIKTIIVDEINKSVFMKIQSTFQLEGNYDMKGNLLFLPIEGKGPVHAKLRKMEITSNCTIIEKLGKDGKAHWFFEHKSHSFVLNGNSDLEFENLFGGDTLLGHATKELVASSGNAIINEVGDPMVKAVNDGLLLRLNKMFDKIPIDEVRIKQ